MAAIPSSKLIAAPTFAALALVASAANAAPPQTPAEALALYPKAAHDGGIDGSAVVVCGRDEHLRHVNCRIEREIPPNLGFGQAALALAALTPANASVTAPPEARDYVSYLFCANPDFIDPNPLEPEHLHIWAELDREPTPAQLAAAMPANAKGVSGRVFITCTAETDGAVDNCAERFERPAEGKLGPVALSLAPHYHAIPGSLDGRTTAESIQIQVVLGPNPPLLAPRGWAPVADACRWRAGLPPLPRRTATAAPDLAAIADALAAAQPPGRPRVAATAPIHFKGRER